MKVLADPAAARAQMDVLTSWPVEIVRAITTKVAGGQRAAVLTAYNAALRGLEADATLSRADRLGALLAQVELARMDAPEDAKSVKLPPALVKDLREHVARDNREITDGYERQAVITTGAYAVKRAGLMTESDALLQSNLAKSHSPYYLMSALASNAKARGDTIEALRWFPQAYRTVGPGHAPAVGRELRERLVELSPQDAARIERAEPVDHGCRTQPNAFNERSARSLQRASSKLQSWNSDGAHAATIKRLQAQLAPVCAKLPAEDAQRSTCEALLRRGHRGESAVSPGPYNSPALRPRPGPARPPTRPDPEEFMSDAHDDQAESHEGPIKTPKQLIAAVFFAFVVPVIVIVMLASLCVERTPARRRQRRARPRGDRARVCMPVGRVEIKDGSPTSAWCAPASRSSTRSAPPATPPAPPARRRSATPTPGAPRIKTGFEALADLGAQGQGRDGRRKAVATSATTRSAAPSSTWPTRAAPSSTSRRRRRLRPRRLRPRTRRAPRSQQGSGSAPSLLFRRSQRVHAQRPWSAVSARCCVVKGSSYRIARADSTEGAPPCTTDPDLPRSSAALRSPPAPRLHAPDGAVVATTAALPEAVRRAARRRGC